jgi:signal transduction histidine kinase/DNA-binding response OmpR family regulator
MGGQDSRSNVGSKIVVVDDSTTKRHVLRDALESAGFQVDEASDGRQALACAQRTPLVILLDIQLPDMDGFEVCRKLRSNPETAGVPIILISAAHTGAGDKLQGFEIGADDYITLPFSEQELLAKVTAWARVRKAEAELRYKNSQLEGEIERRKDREEELTAIYENVPLVMLLVDRDCRILKANRFTERWLGLLDPASLMGQRGGEAIGCFHASDGSGGCGSAPQCGHCVIRQSVSDTWATGESRHQLEATVPLNLEGRVQEVTFLLSTARLCVRGEFQVLVTLQDITARKRAEQGLIRTEKLAATGRLAATIAHEINNPLEAMTNIVYLLGQSIADPGARAYVEMLDKQLQTISHITSQTLKFHRENGRPTEFRLSDLIGEILDFFEAKARRHGVRLVPRLQTQAKIVGFCGEIRQVISNLLLNAIEATPPEGHVAIHLAEATDWRGGEKRGYRVSVADSGSGIDAQHRLRIFEPFFTTKGDKGTGLGLWVTLGIVDRAGGSIRVWSTQRPGRSGTCFSVFLPARASLDQTPGRRRYEPSPPRSRTA